MEEEILTTLKIVIIGQSAVGKSSLLLRFTEDSFDPSQPLTLGVDYKRKKIIIGDSIVNLAIWDTAGMEKFRSVFPSYYRDTQGAILVYDVSRKETFLKLRMWLDELDTYSTNSNIVKMVVGNKIDKENREVTREEGKAFARRYQTLFIETSAKTNDGVQCAFEELVQKILQTPGLWERFETDATSMIHVSEDCSSSIPSCSDWRCSVV